MKKWLFLLFCSLLPLEGVGFSERSPGTLLKTKKKGAKKTEKKDEDISADIIKKGLGYLASKQSGSRFDTGAQYIIDGQISAACLAGLAYTQTGNTFTEGEFSKNLKSLATGMASQQLFPYKERESGNGVQFNWTTGFMLMFLSQASDVGGKDIVSGQINKLIALAKESQDPNGGWTHGKPGMNSLNYSDLAATSLVVLNGLSMAFQAGYDVPQDVLDKGFQYVKDSTLGMNVGYSPRKGQKGMAGAGRNGAAYSALRRVKRTKDGFIEQIQLNDVILAQTGKGHADGMYHYLFVGVAAKNMGGGIWDKYKEDYVSLIPDHQKSDGSFTMLPRTGSEKNKSTMKSVWDTAICCILLGLEKNSTILSDADKDKSKAAIAARKKKAELAKVKARVDKITAEIVAHEKKGNYKKVLSVIKKLAKVDAGAAKAKMAEYHARVKKESEKFDKAYAAQDFGYAYEGYKALLKKYGSSLAAEAKARLNAMKKDPRIKELVKLDQEISKIKKKFDSGQGLALGDLQKLHKVVKEHKGTERAERAQALIDEARARSVGGS